MRVVVPELLARGDPEHLADQVDAGDLLGDAVLDLEAGVHLEEGDGAVLGDEELAGAGADVLRLAQDRLGALVEAAHLVLGQERRGRLLDQLLVAALQRAVAGGDHDDVAVLVGQALGLDVARLVEELLHEALAAAEGGLGLAHRGLEGSATSSLLRATLRPRPPPPKAALIAIGRPFSSANSTASSASSTGSLVPASERGADLLGDVAGLDLVAEVLDRLGRRADPDEPGVDDGLGEVAVLGEEAVAGVHRVGTGLLGGGDDLLDVEVGVGRGGAVEGVRLVGQPHEQGVPVGVGVHRDAARCLRPCTPGSPGRRSRPGWRSEPSAAA